MNEEEGYDCDKCERFHKKYFRGKESKRYVEHLKHKHCSSRGVKASMIVIDEEQSLDKFTKLEACTSKFELKEIDKILVDLKPHRIRNILNAVTTDGVWIVNWRLERKERYDGRQIEKMFTPEETLKYDVIIAAAQGKKLGWATRRSNRKKLKKLLR